MLPAEEQAATSRPGAAILLAAGASTRLGRPKQLVALEGKSLLRRAAEAALASGASPVIVVLGSHEELLRPQLSGLAVFIAVNSTWQQGMGSSLRRGVEALQQEAPTAIAVLCMVCDQPHLTAAHLKVMWDRFAATGKVIAARHGERPGVPAIFPAKYLPDLTQSNGDQGARNLLNALTGGQIELVEIPEAGFDLDTPKDLLRLTAERRGNF